MKENVLALVALVWIMGTGCLVCSPPGEEGRVRKQFELLSEWVSKEPGEKPLTTVRKIRDIETLFAPQCTLQADIDTYSGTYIPEEIAARAATIRSPFSILALRFYDVTIDLQQEGLAMVRVTAMLSGSTASGDSFDQTHELQCTLKQSDGKWLFSRVEVVEVLRR